MACIGGPRATNRKWTRGSDDVSVLLLVATLVLVGITAFYLGGPNLQTVVLLDTIAIMMLFVMFVLHISRRRSQ